MEAFDELLLEDDVLLVDDDDDDDEVVVDVCLGVNPSARALVTASTNSLFSKKALVEIP